MLKGVVMKTQHIELKQLKNTDGYPASIDTESELLAIFDWVISKTARKVADKEIKDILEEVLGDY